MCVFRRWCVYSSSCVWLVKHRQWLQCRQRTTNDGEYIQVRVQRSEKNVNWGVLLNEYRNILCYSIPICKMLVHLAPHKSHSPWFIDLSLVPRTSSVCPLSGHGITSSTLCAYFSTSYRLFYIAIVQHVNSPLKNEWENLCSIEIAWGKWNCM